MRSARRPLTVAAAAPVDVPVGDTPARAAGFAGAPSTVAASTRPAVHVHAPVRRPAPAATDRMREDVEAALAAVRALLATDLAGRVERAARLAPAHADLWRSIGEQVGGRLMRPRLVVAAYLGLGGRDLGALVPVAAAQEVLHTAMLVHDDLLDHDETRRGRPNVAGGARTRLAGSGVTGRRADDQVLAAGVLGGDLALAAAFDLVASADVEPAAALRAVRAMAAAVDVTVAGELLDVAGELAGPTEVDALRVAELKTAAYSCCAPLAAGAVLAGAEEPVLRALDRFGTSLGVAFQLLDDELGVFGDPAVTGKSALSDLREGKRTELLRLAYLHAGDDGRTVLDACVGRADLDEPGAARVRDVIARCGALAEARLVRLGAVADARDALADGVPDRLAQYLDQLVDELGVAA